MSSESIRPGSLVLYKVHPAIVASIGDKIEIHLSNGKSKRVRDKDITLLHPGPLSTLKDLDAGEPSIDEAWELLEGEQVGLPDFAEFLYGDFSPASAWGAWKVLKDGLYFEGSPANITRRSAADVDAEKRAREEKRLAKLEWSEFLERVKTAKLQEGDRAKLVEVERVVFGSSTHSRILNNLKMPETAEGAYRLLLRCGYWPVHFNPWPRRAGARLDPVEIGVPELSDTPRKDLTHLEAWAIDDVGNQDPDDALSIDGERLWVHVADVAALVRPGSHMDQAAGERGANLYLPEKIHTMLPGAVTDVLGLGLAEQSPALSVGFRFDGECVTDIEIVPSLVRVRRATYDDIDRRMNEAPFADIQRVTDAFRASRVTRGAARIDMPEVTVRVVDGVVNVRPLAKLASREMVADAMMMAGEACARFAVAEQVAIPFVGQPEPEEIHQPQTMAEMYAYRRFFKPSKLSIEPERHFGLGLDMYARATSPLRRYSDLIVHQQLRAKVLDQEPLSTEQVIERMAPLDVAGAIVRRAERLSNLHWKLVFLHDNPDWRGDAVVLAVEERKCVIVVPELALETRIRRSSDDVEGQVLSLAVSAVNLPAQSVSFKRL